MSTSQGFVGKDKEANEQDQYVNARQEEQQQSESLRAHNDSIPREDRDYEAGYGGQENLEDRYATTSGEH